MDWNLSDTNSSLEAILKSITDNSFFGIAAMKTIRNDEHEIVDFEWIFANKAAAEIVEFSSEELKGSRLLDVFPGSRETGLFDKYKNVVENNAHQSFEQSYQADELDKWFLFSASRLGDGLMVTFQDISEQKKIQAELETERNKYRQLFQKSIDPAYLLDENLNFLYVNSSFASLFGYKSERLHGIPIKKIFVADNDYTYFKDCLKEKYKIEEFEVILATRDMKIKQCLINSAALIDEEKNQFNYLGVIRDLTRRKQAEREILMAEKLSMTGKIARTMAHEIRNPLTNVNLALGQLKEEIPDEVEDAHMYLSIIERNTSRIGQLIDNLLDSSKPKSLNLTKQPIQKVVSEALELVRDRLNLKSMELVTDFARQEIILRVDKDQMKLALINIFINAIEAMKENYGILKVGIQDRDSHVELIIEDNGKGIPPKDLEKLFDPFFTSKKGGSGLGLTSAQNIINGHKGTIHAKSEVGKGTTFIVRFRKDSVE